MGNKKIYPRIVIERGTDDEEWTAIAMCAYSRAAVRPIGSHLFMVVATDKNILKAMEKLVEKMIEDEDVVIM